VLRVSAGLFLCPGSKNNFALAFKLKNESKKQTSDDINEIRAINVIAICKQNGAREELFQFIKTFWREINLFTIS
jgi:hypothetical protein